MPSPMWQSRQNSNNQSRSQNSTNAKPTKPTKRHPISTILVRPQDLLRQDLARNSKIYLNSKTKNNNKNSTKLDENS